MGTLVGTADGSTITSGATRTIAFGAVRCDPNTGIWSLVEDDLHDPGGILRVETYTDCIRVWYVEAGIPVGTAIATVDERYTLAGVHVGCSGGTSYAEVWFTIEEGPLPYARMDPHSAAFRGSYTNVWIEAKVSAQH